MRYTEFNLIITTYRNMEGKASSELNAFLLELNDPHPDISYTGISGLITCKTSLDPYYVITELKKSVYERPWSIRYILRVIPVQSVTDTDLESICNEAIKLAKRIREEETYRVTVEKRFSGIHSKDIIERIASRIDRKVKLVGYDWNILIEIIGKSTGISVLKDEDIFSAVKIKRDQ